MDPAIKRILDYNISIWKKCMLSFSRIHVGIRNGSIYELSHKTRNLYSKSEEVTLSFHHDSLIKSAMFFDYGGEAHDPKDYPGIPATTYYHKNGNIGYICHHKNDEWHSLNGPAMVEYYEDGSIKRERYFIYGREYSKEIYYSKLKN